MSNENNIIVKNAPDSLRLLWSRGFFKSWKKYSQVVKRLSDDGYNFSDPELGMALQRAKNLTRRGKRTSYEYIQKYPFTKDEKK